MYAEPDEGLGGSPNFSEERQFATFEPEYDSMTQHTKNTTRSFIFPQKLDLSTLNLGKKTLKKKKLSPIKPHHESRVTDFRNSAKNLTAAEKSTDLLLMEHQFDALTSNLLNRSLANRARSVTSSVTSDRAPSVSSSSTVSGSQRSLLVQIRRAKQIVDRVATERKKEVEEGVSCDDDVFLNSDFHLTADDETRPPSSQASLLYEESVEEQRRHGVTSHLISRVTADAVSSAATRKSTSSSVAAATRNAATSTSGFLSDTQVVRVHSRKTSTSSSTSSSSRRSSDAEKTIVDEVFEGFRRRHPHHHRHGDGGGVTPEDVEETPIILKKRDDEERRRRPTTTETSRISGANSAGSQPRIERARDVVPGPSSTSTIGPHHILNDKTMEPRAPHHSLSVLQVSPEKLREVQAHAHLNRSLPNLERFAIRPSTREIFNTPLDIDAICGRGLRKNQRSAEKHFGGSQAAQSIHGKQSAVARRAGSSARAPTRPTTSSAAKRREASRRRDDVPPPRPPYCSATPNIDATSYSINTCSQQLLGTVKSLHPDWLQMTRRLLNADADVDVAALFGKELRKMQLALELKYARNVGSTELSTRGAAADRDDSDDDDDDHRTRLCVIFRILEKLDELRSHGGHFSRVQQIKLIHSALMSA